MKGQIIGVYGKSNADESDTRIIASDRLMGEGQGHGFSRNSENG